VKTEVKYIREGRGACKKCARELDVVAKHVPVPSFYEKWKQDGGLMIARHLNRIEEYTARGARPAGFCLGSFGEPDPVKVPAREKGKRK
jgi:hypothetical protein